MARAFYNEIDRYACDWLQGLMDASLITPGKIDDRSIADLSPDDLRGYKRAHFFAGIAGWDLALQLGGWPDDRPVWTGSCPCQPFSAAGKGKASSDERHLWPEWFRLIRAVRPPTIFGEQVEAAIGWGWLDLVHSDLETEGYTLRSAVLPACSVGAPHIRQRLWFVGQSDSASSAAWQLQQKRSEARPKQSLQSSLSSELAYAERNGGRANLAQREAQRRETHGGASPWSDLIWLPCADGKQRPTQSGIFPLAHGVSGRVAKLRAAGNAIVPQVAAEFIKAAM